MVRSLQNFILDAIFFPHCGDKDEHDKIGKNGDDAHGAESMEAWAPCPRHVHKGASQLSVNNSAPWPPIQSQWHHCQTRGRHWCDAWGDVYETLHKQYIFKTWNREVGAITSTFPRTYIRTVQKMLKSILPWSVSVSVLLLCIACDANSDKLAIMIGFLFYADLIAMIWHEWNLLYACQIS